MADLRDIDNVLKKFEQRFYRHIAKAQLQVARNVTIKLAEKTPVDTGRCQSNWHITDSQGNAPYDPDPPGTADTGIHQRTVKRGSRQGLGYRLVRTNSKNETAQLLSSILVGKTIKPTYIHNRTPYLRYLDRGWSQQAPPGFIRKEATAEYQRRIRKLNETLGDTLGVTVE